MLDVAITSELVEELLSTLIQYRGCFTDLKTVQSEGTNSIRSEANKLLGQVYDDLLELGVSRHFTQYGHVMPIFETALQKVTQNNVKFVHGALSLAVEELERLNGKLKFKRIKIILIR